jgi:putative PEP-CTERM system histidine kinase
VSLVQASYGFAALVYAVLCLLALTRWRQTLRGSWIPPALLCQVIWAATVAAGQDTSPYFASLEVLRSAAWVWVPFVCIAERFEVELRRQQLTVGYVVLVGALVASTALLGSLRGSDALAQLADLQVWANLLLSIAGLIALEQVVRNVTHGLVWHVKFTWLAVGALLVYDLSLWGLSIGFGELHPTLWVARGIVNAIIAVPLLAGLERTRDWQAGGISGRPGFFNAALIGAGIYVISVAVASTYVRSVGGAAGEVIQVAFISGALLVLAVALFSGQFRAWSRVMLAKHLLPYKYDYRTEWLRLTDALRPGDERTTADDVVGVVAGFLGSTHGGLWTIGDEGDLTPSGGFLAPPDGPHVKQGTFTEYLRATGWIFDLDEVRSKGHVIIDSIPPWLLEDRRMWVLVPLICDEQLVGLLIVGRPPASFKLGWEQLDLLRVSARQVASHIAFESAARRVTEMRQFEAFSRLSAFIMHDLRHLIAQQALVIENASRHRHNPHFFEDTITTIESSVQRMKRLMDQLATGREAPAVRRVAMADAVAEAATRCGTRRPVPTMEIYDEDAEVVVNRDGLINALEHLLRNAQDATEPEGLVRVSLRTESGRAIVEFRDNGVGMDKEFIARRLFRPFHSTKGDAGMGIGVYEVREFAKRYSGSLEVDSKPGEGSCFRLILPLFERSAEHAERGT